MLSAKENERLTRVGRGTPMGEFLRRFWLPALLSDELPRSDGDPIRTRTLGEDLVAFRDSNGDAGIVDAYCPHRRGPLFFGRNEECGLRCVYHGWKFDTTGQCVDMPSEPPESDFKERISVKAYPTYETGGMIWIYMGPREHQPERPPEMPFTLVPENERRGLKFLVEANWLQCLEGELDTAHVSFLHSTFGEDGTGIQTLVRNDGYTNDRHPRLFALDTDYGFVYGGRRAQRGTGRGVEQLHGDRAVEETHEETEPADRQATMTRSGMMRPSGDRHGVEEIGEWSNLTIGAEPCKGEIATPRA